MDGSSDGTIERARVREVAAVFHSPAAVEAAAEDLLLAGFDRADIDRLADIEEVRKRLGPVYVAHEELADVPQAPRRPIVMREDITTTFMVVVSLLASTAAMAAAGIVVASRGGTAAAAIAAISAALLAGSLAAIITARMLRPPQSKALEPLTAANGIVLWVRSRSPDREDKARQILQRNGGQAIRVHEIDVEKRTEDIPLSSVRPDPWLGDERLGQP
jgi:hypothetical protein